MTEVAHPRAPSSADEPSEPPVRGPEDFDKGYTYRLLGIVMLAVMGFGSLMTIVTVSLKLIADDLGTDTTTLGWVVTGLMLAMAVASPLTGKLGDIYGHRKMLLCGLALGAVTTFLCGLAWNAASLIFFRVLFGLSGALLMPNGMAMMMHAYGPGRRASAMGWFQFAMTGAPTIGLIIGGPLIDVVGWRPIFFAFSLVSLVALGIGLVVLRETPRQASVPLDYLGALLLGLGVLGVLLGITRGAGNLRAGGLSALAGNPVTLALLVAGVVLLAGFVRHEGRVPFPMLKLRYFRRRRFSMPLLSSALNQFAYMGGFVVVPLLLGDVYGWTVAGIALIMAPRPGAFSLSAPIGGFVASRFGERVPMVIGTGCIVASMLCFAASSGGYSAGGLVLIVAGLLLSGISAGIASPGYASMVAGAVDPEDMGIANGMSQQVMFIGIVSGIQLMLVVLGTDPSTGEYGRTFLFGALVGLAGLVAAIGARPSRADSV